MSQPPITLYVTGWCPYCQRAKSLLDSKQLVFSEINVDEDPKLRQEMTARSGRRTVPQIFIGERHVGGCDDLLALEASGELDQLVSNISGQGA
jgi:glutaredoxin 3